MPDLSRPLANQVLYEVCVMLKLEGYNHEQQR